MNLPAKPPALIIARVLRRLHTPRLVAGLLSLDEKEAHHIRDVLRLKIGDRVEVFDDGGSTGTAEVTACDSRRVTLQIDQVVVPSNRLTEIVIASAIPKGERADWMIEKLSELGVTRFIPLQTTRGVVEPGKNKLDRWRRIAPEAAKQSRRLGVMKVDESSDLATALSAVSPSPGTPGEGLRESGVNTRPSPQPSPRILGEGVAALYLSTAPDVASIVDTIATQPKGALALFIGPEGGWTDSEIMLFQKHNLTAARLTATILRVETAAVATAAIAAVLRDSHSNDP